MYLRSAWNRHTTNALDSDDDDDDDDDDDNDDDDSNALDTLWLIVCKQGCL